MDIHGQPRNVTWTTLNETAYVGVNEIVLSQPVDWQINEKIVISTTSYIATETEVFTIVNISLDRQTLTLNSNLLYDHLCFVENSIQIAAAVGLLTRNVKIIGSEYPQQENDLYGFSILVTDQYNYDVNGLLMYYKGYARLSNVEFYHSGQYNRDVEVDTPFGVMISNLGAYNSQRPTYLRSCAFHHGYYAAIGILGSSSIPIENNVIYRTLDYSIYLEGDSNIVRNNLITMNYWASSFISWEAEFDLTYWGAIDAHNADSVVIENNFIAGAERCGLNYKGDTCAGDSVGFGLNNSIINNIIHGALAGVTVFPTNSFLNISCLSISNFTVYKSSHWGIYYQGDKSLIMDSNNLIDNQVNIFTMIHGPSSLTHSASSKNVQLRNSLIVGRSSSFDCTRDVKPSDLNFLQANAINAFGAGFQYI